MRVSGTGECPGNQFVKTFFGTENQEIDLKKPYSIKEYNLLIINKKKVFYRGSRKRASFSF